MRIFGDPNEKGHPVVNMTLQRCILVGSRDAGATSDCRAGQRRYPVRSLQWHEVRSQAELLKFSSAYENIMFFPDTTVRIHGKIALVTGKADFVHTATNISHIHVLYVWEKGGLHPAGAGLPTEPWLPLPCGVRDQNCRFLG